MSKRKKVHLEPDGWDYKYFRAKIRGIFTTRQKNQVKEEVRDLLEGAEYPEVEDMYHERMYGWPYHPLFD